MGWLLTGVCAHVQLPVTTIREIKVLKCLNHRNLVELKEVVVSSENDDDDGVWCLHCVWRFASTDRSCTGEFTDKDEPLDYCHGSIYLVLEYVEHDLTGLIDRQYPYVFNCSVCREGGSTDECTRLSGSATSRSRASCCSCLR